MWSHEPSHTGSDRWSDTATECSTGAGLETISRFQRSTFPASSAASLASTTSAPTKLSSRPSSQREPTLEMRLEQALVARMASFADYAANHLVTERAALQGRLDQATAAAELRCEAGLAASDAACKLTMSCLADSHRDELRQAV